MSTALAAHAIPTNDLRQLFDFCNARYFANEITPSAGFRLRYSRSERLFGSFSYCPETHTDWEIAIASRLVDHPFALLSTTVHEMIHMLAHQLYRLTGDPGYLDQEPVPGKRFDNRGHGAFFLREMARLNGAFPELDIAVKSLFGNRLYDLSRIPPARVLLVTIDRRRDKGMVYRLHSKAELDWSALRDTAESVHGVTDISVLQVAGHLADGFPALRRDNRYRVNMKPRRLRHFARKVTELQQAPGTVHLLETPRPAVTGQRRAPLRQTG